MLQAAYPNNKKILGYMDPRCKQSILIVHDLIERYPGNDGDDESDKHTVPDKIL